MCLSRISLLSAADVIPESYGIAQWAELHSNSPSKQCLFPEGRLEDITRCLSCQCSLLEPLAHSVHDTSTACWPLRLPCTSTQHAQVGW